MKDGNLDYISNIILEVYQENFSEDNYYVSGKKDRLMQNEGKLDGLFCLYNLDKNLQKQFANKLGVEYEDLQVFMKVLKKV